MSHLKEFSKMVIVQKFNNVVFDFRFFLIIKELKKKLSRNFPREFTSANGNK